MLKIEKNVYTIQGKGVWGVFQVSHIAFLIGRSANGPRWYLTLFKPHVWTWSHPVQFHIFHR